METWSEFWNLVFVPRKRGQLTVSGQVRSHVGIHRCCTAVQSDQSVFLTRSIELEICGYGADDHHLELDTKKEKTTLLL
jgi:hypothetical protein